MAKKKDGKSRRQYNDELKAEAVQMLLDGHSATSVASRLGLSGTNILYRWKAKMLSESGPAATALEARVQQLEKELHPRADTLLPPLLPPCCFPPSRLNFLSAHFLVPIHHPEYTAQAL